MQLRVPQFSRWRALVVRGDFDGHADTMINRGARPVRTAPTAQAAAIMAVVKDGRRPPPAGADGAGAKTQPALRGHAQITPRGVPRAARRGMVGSGERPPVFRER